MPYEKLANLLGKSAHAWQLSKRLTYEILVRLDLELKKCRQGTLIRMQLQSDYLKRLGICRGAGKWMLVHRRGEHVDYSVSLRAVQYRWSLSSKLWAQNHYSASAMRTQAIVWNTLTSRLAGTASTRVSPLKWARHSVFSASIHHSPYVCHP